MIFRYIKNILYYINFETKQISLNKFENSKEKYLFNETYFLKARNILYFISETEQEARINQLYQYLVDNIDRFFDVPKSIIFEEIIRKTNDITLIMNFRDEIEKIFVYLSNNNYKPILVVSYYLNKLNYIHYRTLSEESMLKIFNIIYGRNYEYTNIDCIIVNKTYDILYDKLQKYQKRIYDVISKIFIDKN